MRLDHTSHSVAGEGVGWLLLRYPVCTVVNNASVDRRLDARIRDYGISDRVSGSNSRPECRFEHQLRPSSEKSYNYESIRINFSAAVVIRSVRSVSLKEFPQEGRKIFEFLEVDTTQIAAIEQNRWMLGL